MKKKESHVNLLLDITAGNKIHTITMIGQTRLKRLILGSRTKIINLDYRLDSLDSLDRLDRVDRLDRLDRLDSLDRLE